jgi:hypothetical protein
MWKPHWQDIAFLVFLLVCGLFVTGPHWQESRASFIVFIGVTVLLGLVANGVIYVQFADTIHRRGYTIPEVLITTTAFCSVTLLPALLLGFVVTYTIYGLTFEGPAYSHSGKSAAALGTILLTCSAYLVCLPIVLTRLALSLKKRRVPNRNPWTWERIAFGCLSTLVLSFASYILWLFLHRP